MEMRYMTYKNEEGQKERFYPITHKDAIIGLSDVPELDPLIETRFTEIETEVVELKSDLIELESRPVNNNILINSNFANPVNQRGYVSGTDYMTSYSIDRWKGQGNITIVDKKYITSNVIIGTTSNTLIQQLEFPEIYTGKSLTLSVRCRTSSPKQFQLFMDGDANGSYASLGYPVFINSEANKWEEFSYTFKISESQVFTRLVCGFNTSGSFDIEWMKLEIGDHATPYVPRLYGEEFELCQRYYSVKRAVEASLFGVTSTTLCFNYNTGEMRIKPTVDYSECIVNKNDIEQTGFKFNQPATYGNGGITFFVIKESGNHNLSETSLLTLGGWIKFDAEL